MHKVILVLLLLVMPTNAFADVYLQYDNDAAFSDRDYTWGARVAYDKFLVAHENYTPEYLDGKKKDNISNDRPYASFAYGGFFFVEKGFTHQFHIGTIGQFTMGEEIQSEAHRFIVRYAASHSPVPSGWHTQRERLVAVRYSVSGGLKHAGFTAELGNVVDTLAFSVYKEKIGDLPFSYEGLIARATLKWVAYNYLLGNNHRNFVTEIELGVAYGGYAISIITNSAEGRYPKAKRHSYIRLRANIG